MTLYDDAMRDDDLYQVLMDTNLNHQQAYEKIQFGLFVETSRTSVRRAREQLGVLSPESTAPVYSAAALSVTERSRDLNHRLASEAYEKPSPETWSRGVPAVAVIIGDYQIGLHDRAFIDRQCQIIRDLNPDIVISTGDELDFTSLGRWVQGLPGQYGRSIHEERQVWVNEIAPQISEAAPNAQKRMCDSNHIRRLPQSVERLMPGLADAPELFVKNFLHLDELGWVFDEGPTEFLPGVVYSHGDDWNVTSRGQSQKFREVIKTRQANVVFGHSHQAGLYTTALGYGYNMDTKFALNVGHGMVLREAQYIKSTSPDWSRGIGILYYDGESVHPELHLEVGGKIRVNGKSY